MSGTRSQEAKADQNSDREMKYRKAADNLLRT